MTPLLIGALVLFALRRAPVQPQTDGQGAGGPGAGGAAPPVGDGTVGDILKGVGTGVSVAATAVGALASAGVIGGGGTAAAATAGGATLTAGAGTGAASSGTGAAASTSAGTAVGTGISGSLVAAAIGWTAVVVAINVVIFAVVYGVQQATARYARWCGWRTKSWDIRFHARAFKCEADTYASVVDKGRCYFPIIDPETGVAPPVPESFTTSRDYVRYLSKVNCEMDMYVPRGVTMDPAELLKVQRLCRWFALTRLYWENKTRFDYTLSWGKEDPQAINQGVAPGRWEQWRDTFCADEVYAAEIGYRCACTWGELEATAKKEFGAAYDVTERSARFLGISSGLTECAIQGYSTFRPQDFDFCFTIGQRAGLMTPITGAPWRLENRSLTGRMRYVLIDPATNMGIDLVQSRDDEHPVVFPPASLGLPTIRPPENRSTSNFARPLVVKK